MYVCPVSFEVYAVPAIAIFMLLIVLYASVYSEKSHSRPVKCTGIKFGPNTTVLGGELIKPEIKKCRNNFFLMEPFDVVYT